MQKDRVHQGLSIGIVNIIESQFMTQLKEEEVPVDSKAFHDSVAYKTLHSSSFTVMKTSTKGGEYMNKFRLTG